MRRTRIVTTAGRTDHELERIGSAEELEIAPYRQDGTLHPAVTIWIVRVDEDLYVRSYRGATSRWLRNARTTGEARIRANGVTKEVVLTDVGDDINDDIDAAYRIKYSRYANNYVKPMLRPEVRQTTMRLVPRGGGERRR